MLFRSVNFILSNISLRLRDSFSVYGNRRSSLYLYAALLLSLELIRGSSKLLNLRSVLLDIVK